jgi:hypothetical protein
MSVATERIPFLQACLFEASTLCTNNRIDKELTNDGSVHFL